MRGRKPVPYKDRYGQLTVLRQIIDAGIYYLECKCDCGTVKAIKKGQIMHGKTISCGCRWRESKKAKPVESAKPMRGHIKLSDGDKEKTRRMYLSGNLPKWMFS